MQKAPDRDISLEAGEAIGNVGLGRRLFRRRKRFDVQQALARWAARVPLPKIPLTEDADAPSEGEVIDGTCRVIDDKENGDEHG
jgi:hypothetical protein